VDFLDRRKKRWKKKNYEEAWETVFSNGKKDFTGVAKKGRPEKGKDIPRKTKALYFSGVPRGSPRC